jgi:hypothetical protein
MGCQKYGSRDVPKNHHLLGLFCFLDYLLLDHCLIAPLATRLDVHNSTFFLHYQPFRLRPSIHISPNVRSSWLAQYIALMFAYAMVGFCAWREEAVRSEFQGRESGNNTHRIPWDK